MSDSTKLRIQDWRSIGPLLAAIGKPLNAPQVEQLVRAYDLRVKVDDRRAYLESERHGLALLTEDGLVHTIFLYGGGKDDFARYLGTLPDGLSFDWTKSEVRSRLGTPEQSPDLAAPLVDIDWDRFEFSPWYLHFTYHTTTETIALLAVFPKDGETPLEDAIPSRMQAFDAVLGRIDAVIDLDRDRLPAAIPSVKAELRAIETPDIAAEIAYLLGYLTYLHPERLVSHELQSETREHLTRALPSGAARLYLGHHEYDLRDYETAAQHFDEIVLAEVASHYVRLKVLEMRACCEIHQQGIMAALPAIEGFVIQAEGHPVQDIWPEELARTLTELALTPEERAVLLPLAERLDRKGKFGEWFGPIVRGPDA